MSGKCRLTGNPSRSFPKPGGAGCKCQLSKEADAAGVVGAGSGADQGSGVQTKAVLPWAT